MRNAVFVYANQESKITARCFFSPLIRKKGGPANAGFDRTCKRIRVVMKYRARSCKFALRDVPCLWLSKAALRAGTD